MKVMKFKVNDINYFFVDEAGDPVFYNKHKKVIVGEEGCSRTLLMGFISTDSPKEIRDALAKLKNEISHDMYLATIPSIKKSVISFHAKR